MHLAHLTGFEPVRLSAVDFKSTYHSGADAGYNQMLQLVGLLYPPSGDKRLLRTRDLVLLCGSDASRLLRPMFCCVLAPADCVVKPSVLFSCSDPVALSPDCGADGVADCGALMAGSSRLGRQ